MIGSHCYRVRKTQHFEKKSQKTTYVTSEHKIFKKNKLDLFEKKTIFWLFSWRGVGGYGFTGTTWKLTKFHKQNDDIIYAPPKNCPFPFAIFQKNKRGYCPASKFPIKKTFFTVSPKIFFTFGEKKRKILKLGRFFLPITKKKVSSQMWTFNQLKEFCTLKF